MAARNYKISDPTRSRERVCLYDYVTPSDWIMALYNPTSFEGEIKATIGAPQPVGWVGPIIQYGSTSAVEGVALNLVFDERERLRGKKQGVYSSWSDYESALRWLASRVHPRGIQKAPSLVNVVWPNTVTMLAAIAGVKVNVTRWDAYLNVRAATITVSLQEMVQGFRSASGVAKDGFLMSRTRQGDGMGSSGGEVTWGRQRGLSLGTESGAGTTGSDHDIPATG